MNNYKNYIILALLVSLAVLVLIVVPKRDKDVNTGTDNEPVSADIKDYISCAEAGYPVMESYPAKCRTPDGREFVEDIRESAEVVITTPTRGQKVNSPLTVTGKAKGSWFFEANIPVTLKDQNGKILVQKGAQAQGEWMNEDYVNFSVVLEFAQPNTEFGVLLIQKDNPSGLPQNDSEFAIPVSFK